MVYISTDSSSDLTDRNSELVRFEKVTNLESDPCLSVLEFPNKWEVGSKSGCGCTFRHLYIESVQLGFSEPEDWYQEEKDELDATRELYQALNDILESGYQVDLVDRWEGAEPSDITTVEVSLGEVSEAAFRMFEDHKFKLKKEQKKGQSSKSQKN
jgi:hypothetical protein